MARIRKPIQFWTLIAVSLVTLTGFTWQIAQPQTMLQVAPQELRVKVGGEVTVDLAIAQVSELYGVEVHLRFDPNVVEVVDADALIDLSHVKGHGDCGFGGSLKNIAMGTVPRETRSKIHLLEGGLTLDRDRCKYCLKCFKACPNNAIWKDDEKKEITFFFHHCTYCQHCEMVCPEEAIKMEDRKFKDFSRGMAFVTAAFLKKFKPKNLLFINFLTNITMYCDCWEFSSPSLVPDIGILVGTDIAAIETASLDMIKTENLLSGGLPKDRDTLGEGKHLFEKIHAKDPYLMIEYLQEYYPCTNKYVIEEVK